MKWSNKDPRQVTKEKRLLVMIESNAITTAGFTEMRIGDDGRIWREGWGCLLAAEVPSSESNPISAWNKSWYWIPMPEKE